MASLMRAVRNTLNIARHYPVSSRLMSSNEWGSGAGKGGGTGGSVRDAGGAFGKMEAAHEEQYFRKLQSQQLAELKNHLQNEIKEHEEAIARHKEKIKKLQQKEGKGSGSDSD